MDEHRRKEPGPDHPITLEDAGVRVVVHHQGRIIADSARALALAEASYPLAYYIPQADVMMDHLTASPTRTFCPYKGYARYFSSGDTNDVAWAYDEPYPAVAQIAGYVAFYVSKVDALDTEAL
ncbi:MAG: DUF427 domain-containing protein [Pseudomonadota bacterium]